jgi:hypothetical protein
VVVVDDLDHDAVRAEAARDERDAVVRSDLEPARFDAVEAALLLLESTPELAELRRGERGGHRGVELRGSSLRVVAPKRFDQTTGPLLRGRVWLGCRCRQHLGRGVRMSGATAKEDDSQEGQA